jgi:hypothetical protein
MLLQNQALVSEIFPLDVLAENAPLKKYVSAITDYF